MIIPTTTVPSPLDSGKLIKLLELTLQFLPKFAEALVAIGKVLGLIPKHEEAENLGNKIIQAEEENIKIGNFDTYEDYMDAIDDFEIDAENCKDIDINEKLAKTVEFVVAALREKYPEAGFDKLFEVIVLSDENRDFFTAERFVELAEVMEEQPQVIEGVTKLLSGEDMCHEEYVYIMDILMNIEKKLSPEKSIDDIEKYLHNLG